jgi:hypothetical protein
MTFATTSSASLCLRPRCRQAYAMGHRSRKTPPSTVAPRLGTSQLVHERRLGARKLGIRGPTGRIRSATRTPARGRVLQGIISSCRSSPIAAKQARADPREAQPHYPHVVGPGHLRKGESSHSTATWTAQGSDGVAFRSWSGRRTRRRKTSFQQQVMHPTGPSAPQRMVRTAPHPPGAQSAGARRARSNRLETDPSMAESEPHARRIAPQVRTAREGQCATRRTPRDVARTCADSCIPHSPARSQESRDRLASRRAICSSAPTPHIPPTIHTSSVPRQPSHR